jgi:hypothetical protein
MTAATCLSRPVLAFLSLASLSLVLGAPPALAQPAPVPPAATDGPPLDVPVEPDPSGPGTPTDLRGFEAGFAAGQALFDRGQFLPAARTWAETAALMTEGPDTRDNRAALFEYIADAYTRALAGDAPPERVREALAVLDRYADDLAGAHGPGTLPGPKVEAARAALRDRLSQKPVVAAPAPEGPRPAPAARDQPPAPARPWRGLAVGGGLGIGLGVAGMAVFAVSAVGARSAERRFDDPARACDPAALAGECAEIWRAGRTAQTEAIVGAVIGSVGLVTGAALLAVAHRRRTTALAPRLAPGFAGLGLSGRF